jgi:hypothetical protein
MKGQLKYIPKEVMAEIGRIRFEFNLPNDGEALRKLAKRSDMMRELKMNLDFGLRKHDKR